MPELIRSQRCVACSGRHRFWLPPVDPIAPLYLYVCPASGRTATISPFGPWKAFATRPPDAVALSPVSPPPGNSPGCFPPPTRWDS